MWVAWRQQRYVVSAFALLTVLLAGWAFKSGHELQALLHHYNAAPCHNGNGFAVKYQNFCGGLVHRLSSSQSSRNVISGLGVALPLVMGIALGVTCIASELDRKTVRLAWTQSVSRTKWITTKVIVSLAAMLVLLVPLCFVFSWWVHASNFAPRIAPTGFTLSGWELAVFGFFAFAFSLLIGLLVRRPGWAAGAAAVLVLAVFYLVSLDVRPHLVPLSESRVTDGVVTKGSTTFSFQNGGAPRNSWEIFNGFIPVDSNSVPSSWSVELPLLNSFNSCQQPVGGVGANQETYCLKKLGLKNVSFYVADNQFWNLQLREGGLYVALSALFVGLSVYGVKRINI